MSRYTSWEARGLGSLVTHAERHARREDVRARVLRVLLNVGAEGITAPDLWDELATRAKRTEVHRETSRMSTDGLAVHEVRLASHGPRWYLTDAGRAAAGKAAA